MSAREMRAKSSEELGGTLVDLKKEQFNLRFQQASGQLENTARVKTVRRDIARVRTILGAAQTGTVAVPVKEQKMAGKLAEKAARPTAREEAKKEPRKEPKKEGKIAALREKAKAVVKKATAKKAPAKKAPAKKAPAKKATTKKATAKKATAKKVTKTAKKPAKAAAKKA
ncbi:MAG: 50S ribosomal protein L29 [Proteobacteria bacterium]|nr:50S ribosomal protein L29 [Pseudomonadota bacterium]